MFSFGWSEIALTAIIVIIVVGPKEIPNLLKQIGSFSKSIKKISREFKKSLNDIAEESDLKDVKDQISEIKNIKAAVKPIETMLVADSLTGQIAVKLASEFDKAVQLTSIILTRVDGDGRGGAALSMKQTTGKPIKFMGVGEKIDDLESFHPDMNLVKIHSDAYNQESTPVGERIEGAEQAIRESVEKGSVLVNYIGHGGETGWAHEQILTVPTIQ